MGKQLSSEEKRLLIEDVNTLSMFSSEVNDSLIRNLSGLLRKLIVDNGLINISNEYLGHNMFYINARVVKDPKLIEHEKFTVFAVSSHRKGMEIGYVSFVEGKALDPTDTPLDEGLRMVEFRENIPLHEFGKTLAVGISGVVINGEEIVKVVINREEIVKYVTNKMQGVHRLDQRRSNKRELERKYRALDPLWDQWGIAGGNSILTTLLGIAQEITSSPSYTQLLEKARKEFPGLLD